MIKSSKTLGRLELLSWLNELVESDYPKVETCCDGIAYCQILDAICPQMQVPLHKLNFSAKSKEDCMKNLKLFAINVKRLKLPFAVDATGLSNGRF